MRTALVMPFVMLLAAPAHAFVCQRAGDAAGNANGPALTWGTRTVAFALNAAGTSQLDPNSSNATLKQAFQVWQNLTLDPNEAATCGNLPGTDMQFVQSASTDANWVGYNFLDPTHNVNLLVFHDTFWNKDPNATDVIALTTTTYSALTGEILDADIEFNSFQYSFVTANPSGTQMDLLNTAVHEVGHFLGLGHCATSGACGHQEVMEPTSNYGETQKRMLKCDDRAGMVFKYPSGAGAQYCNSPNATCGFCAPPPSNITQVPSLSQTAESTGRSACQAAPIYIWPLAIMAIVWRSIRASMQPARARGDTRRHARRDNGRRAFGGLVMLALVSATVTACGDGPTCNGQVTPDDPRAPRITDMTYLNAETDDPWRADIAADFVDIDGDLGGGVVNFYSGGPNAITYPLAPIFSASGGLPRNAKTGRIGLRVRLAQSAVDGSVLHLGTQLVDAAGHSSNCYGLDLSVSLRSGTVSHP